MSNKPSAHTAKKLKQFRLAKDLTQAEVAQFAGITPNHYARIERAESSPNTAVLKAIVKGLGIKSQDVLDF